MRKAIKKAPLFATICVLALVLCAIPLFAKAPIASAEPAETDWSQLVPGVDYREGEVIVGFVDEATVEDAEAVAESYGFTLARTLTFGAWPGGNIVLITLPEGVSVLDGIDTLAADPLVTYAEPNMIGYLDDPIVGAEDPKVDDGDESDPQDGGYGLWIAGMEITEDNCGDIVDAINDAYGSTAAYGWAGYDASTNTLYMSDLDYDESVGWTGWTGTIPGIGNAVCAIYCTHDLTIVAVGDENYIAATASGNLNGYSRFGIYVNGDLTIKSIDYYDEIHFFVDDVPSGLTGCGIYGMYANNIFLDGTYVYAFANTPSSGSPSYGVYATKSLKFGFDAWLYADCYQYAVNRKPTFTSDAYKPYVYAGAQGDDYNWTERNISSYGYTDPGVAICAKPSLKRLAGSDRYATGAAIIDIFSYYGGDWSTTVFLATGKDYPDALCASALAGSYDAPILMVEPNKLPAATAAALKKLHPQYIGVVGGTGAVSDSVVQAACNLTGVPNDETHVHRFAGANRYATGLAIYQDGGLSGGDTCIIATGTNFADALSISPYAYATETPIFLADGKTHKLNDETVAALRGEGFEKVIIVGGTGVVSDEVVTQLGATQCVRLAGSNRYATSVAIAKWELEDYESGTYAFGPSVDFYVSNISVATGSGFADALAGGVLCGYYQAPLLLVGSSASSNSEAIKLLKDNAYGSSHYYERGYVFGGTGAVSAAVKASLDAALQVDNLNDMSLPDEGQGSGRFGK